MQQRKLVQSATSSSEPLEFAIVPI